MRKNCAKFKKTQWECFLTNHWEVKIPCFPGEFIGDCTFQGTFKVNQRLIYHQYCLPLCGFICFRLDCEAAKLRSQQRAVLLHIPDDVLSWRQWRQTSLTLNVRNAVKDVMCRTKLTLLHQLEWVPMWSRFSAHFIIINYFVQCVVNTYLLRRTQWDLSFFRMKHLNRSNSPHLSQRWKLSPENSLFWVSIWKIFYPRCVHVQPASVDLAFSNLGKTRRCCCMCLSSHRHRPNWLFFYIWQQRLENVQRLQLQRQRFEIIVRQVLLKLRVHGNRRYTRPRPALCSVSCSNETQRNQAPDIQPQDFLRRKQRQHKGQRQLTTSYVCVTWPWVYKVHSKHFTWNFHSPTSVTAGDPRPGLELI